MDRKISLGEVMRVLQRAICCMDARFEHHGEQVAYLLLNLCWVRGYREADLLRLASLAMIHDLGAYKPDERDRLLKLEVFNPGEHSVYGYLLYREHGPDKVLAPMFLYHHWHWRHNDRKVNGIPVPREAYLLHLSDRIAVLHGQAGPKLKDALVGMLDLQRGEAFAGEDIDLMDRIVKETTVIDSLVDGSYIGEVYSRLSQVSLDWSQAIAYLTLLATAIDFRCEKTATYSFSVQVMARKLGELMGIDDPLDRIYLDVVALIQGFGRFSIDASELSNLPKLSDAERIRVRRLAEKTTKTLLADGLFHSLYDEVNQNNPQMSRIRETVIAAEALVSLVEAHRQQNRDEALAYLGSLVEERRITMDAYNAVALGYDNLLQALVQAQHGVNERYRQLDREFHDLLQAYKSVSV